MSKRTYGKEYGFHDRCGYQAFLGMIRQIKKALKSGGLRKKLCKQYLTKLDKAKITGISLI